MQSSRLLAILLRLQTQGRVSAAVLAQAFEVSVRTIYRDIDALSAAGVPVYAEKGRHGGFVLRGGYRTHLTGLNRPEAESLFLAGVPVAAAQLGLGPALDTTRMKLLAALPDAARQDAQRVASRFHIDPVGWFQGPDEQALLPELAAAVWSQRLLQVRYDSWKGVVERRLAPLGLVLKGGLWYLVAAACNRAGWHVFDIPIESVDVAVGELLRLGPDVQAVGPAPLRRALRNAVQALHAVYGGAQKAA